LIAPSRFLRERYAECGVERERIVVCGYGMNTSSVAKRTKPTTGRLIFGYLGTWMPTKGVHLLVDAFASVPENQAELRLYGSPPNPHHDEYAAVIVRNGKGRANIRFMGRYGLGQVDEILAAMHVLVVPSIWHENAPLTIHEAFMAGVPVITSNIGGMAELVRDGVDGLHFEVGQASDLREKIMRLIEDRDLLTRLAAATPEVKSLELHADELGRMYDDLIRNRQSRMCT
jgi:glycosyltransferase involved in cell wall biosynthesis